MVGRVMGWGGAVVLVAAFVGFFGCATGQQQAAAPSVYLQLDGRQGIAKIVDDFVVNVVADERINARFKALQPAQVFKLKSYLADQICDATGGPCAYVGRDMKTTHKGMNITEA